MARRGRRPQVGRQCGRIQGCAAGGAARTRADARAKSFCLAFAASAPCRGRDGRREGAPMTHASSRRPPKTSGSSSLRGRRRVWSVLRPRGGSARRVQQCHAMFLLRHRCRVWSADHGRCCFEPGHDGAHHVRSGHAFGPKRELPALLWDGVKAHDSLEDMVDSWRVVRDERSADVD
jgi:hypothetical protein